MSDKGEPPRDPHSRGATEVEAAAKGAVTVRLECGHVAQRRPICIPSRVICQEC